MDEETRKNLEEAIALRPSQVMLVELKKRLAEMPDQYDEEYRNDPKKLGRLIADRTEIELGIENLEQVCRKESYAMDRDSLEEDAEEMSPEEQAEKLKAQATKNLKEATIALKVFTEDADFQEALKAFTDALTPIILEPLMPYLTQLAKASNA